MKVLTLKTKINLCVAIAFFAMLVLQLVLQFIKSPAIRPYTVFFTIAGFIYIGYILFREFVTRNKYTIFIAYIILIVLFVFIILIFNLLAKSTPGSTALFMTSMVFAGLALLLSIRALAHDLEWYKNKVQLVAHISASAAVILTMLNLVLNYTWHNTNGNMILIIICLSMLNVMLEALIRSLKLKALSFFADTYLLTGIASLLAIAWLPGAI